MKLLIIALAVLTCVGCSEVEDLQTAYTINNLDTKSEVWLLSTLDSPNQTLAIMSLHELGKRGSPKGADFALRKLEIPSWRLDAASYLAKLGREEAIPPLIEALSSDPAPPQESQILLMVKLATATGEAYATREAWIEWYSKRQSGD